MPLAGLSGRSLPSKTMNVRHLMPIVAVMLTLVTGCASQPHFVDSIGTPQDGNARQLTVLPVKGVGPDVGRALGENMAWGLREAGYPAYYATESGPDRPFVRGEVDEIEIGSQVVWLSLRWLVYDVGERLHGIHRHQVAISLDDWTSLSPKTIALIVTEAVPAVHERAASLIFPGGYAPPPKLAISSDRQLASLSGSTDGGTVIVSGDGLAVVGPDESFETAQFEPVFEPAAREPSPEAPSTPTPAEPELESVFYAPAPPKPEEPVMPQVAVPEADTVAGGDFNLGGGLEASATVPKPPGEDRETFIDVSAIESLGGSLVENEPASGEAVSDDLGSSIASKPEASDPDEPQIEAASSPFSQIDDTASQLSEPDVLTPEAAALVTTDPWLTIAEPVTPQEVAEADDEASAEGAVVDAPLSETVVFEQPPPPAPPSAPETVDETVDQTGGAVVGTADPLPEPVIEPLPEADVEALPEPVPPPAAESAPVENKATEVAAGSVSAGDLGVKAPMIITRPIFLVRGVQGAPGDGNVALTRSIREALRRIDVPVTDDPQSATHVLQGGVRVDSPFAGRQKVRIVWQVTGIDGSVVGQAMQENQVPQGSLDGAWGATADAVSVGAVGGIAKLFKNPVPGTAPAGLSQPDLPHVGND